MRIVIVGAGQVGRSLQEAFGALGHEVVMARRAPQAAGEVALAGCAVGADAVVLAVPFRAVGDVVPQLGLMPGQLLMDATNPFGRAWPDGTSAAQWPSGGALVASLANGAHVVKCFNTIGYEHMVDPVFAGRPALATVCGDDAAAKAVVIGWCEELGFDTVDIGGLDKAALTENLGLLWGTIASTAPFGRDVAFGLLHRT